MDHLPGNNGERRRCRGVLHIVKKDDTLYKIAKKHGVPLSWVMYANPYVDVYNLQIGDEICVPMPGPRPPFHGCPGGGRPPVNGCHPGGGRPPVNGYPGGGRPPVNGYPGGGRPPVNGCHGSMCAGETEAGFTAPDTSSGNVPPARERTDNTDSLNGTNRMENGMPSVMRENPAGTGMPPVMDETYPEGTNGPVMPENPSGAGMPPVMDDNHMDGNGTSAYMSESENGNRQSASGMYGNRMNRDQPFIRENPANAAMPENYMNRRKNMMDENPAGGRNPVMYGNNSSGEIAPVEQDHTFPMPDGRSGAEQSGYETRPESMIPSAYENNYENNMERMPGSMGHGFMGHGYMEEMPSSPGMESGMEGMTPPAGMQNYMEGYMEEMPGSMGYSYMEEMSPSPGMESSMEGMTPAPGMESYMEEMHSSAEGYMEGMVPGAENYMEEMYTPAGTEGYMEGAARTPGTENYMEEMPPSAGMEHTTGNGESSLPEHMNERTGEMKECHGSQCGGMGKQKADCKKKPWEQSRGDGRMLENYLHQNS